MVNFFIGLGFYCIVLDSGGWSGLRYAGLLILVSYFIFTINPKCIGRLKKQLTLSGFLIASLIPSFLFREAHNDDVANAFFQVAPILSLPILIVLMSAYKRKTIEELLYWLAILFSSTIILFFIGRMLGIGFAETLAETLRDVPDAGYFDYKLAGFGVMTPVVYFKATLILVPIGIFFLWGNKQAIFYLCMTAVAVSPSRTGFLVMSVFFIYHYIITFNSRIHIKILASVGTLLTFSFVIYMLNFEFESGLVTRFLHVQSVLNLFQDNIFILLFGQGAGTEFYTSGFDSFATGIEISQLEHARRHGVVSLLALIAVWWWAGKRNEKWRPAILSLWLVSLSNPVLTLFFSMILFSIILNYKNLKGGASNFRRRSSAALYFVAIPRTLSE